MALERKKTVGSAWETVDAVSPSGGSPHLAIEQVVITPADLLDGAATPLGYGVAALLTTLHAGDILLSCGQDTEVVWNYPNAAGFDIVEETNSTVVGPSLANTLRPDNIGSSLLRHWIVSPGSGPPTDPYGGYVVATGDVRIYALDGGGTSPVATTGSQVFRLMIQRAAP